MLNFSHNVQESGLYTYLYSRNPSFKPCSGQWCKYKTKAKRHLKEHM